MMVDRKQKYSVKEFAEVCGVSPRTLKYYEECGLFSPAGRLDNGYRYYLLDQTDDLLTIRLYQEYGYDLDTIKVMVHPSSLQDYQDALQVQQDMTSKQIRRLNVKKSLAAWKEKEIANAMKNGNQAFLGTISRRIRLSMDVSQDLTVSDLEHLAMSDGLIFSASSGKLLAAYAPDSHSKVLLNGDCLFQYVQDDVFDVKKWIRGFRHEAGKLHLQCTKICMEPIIVQNEPALYLLRLFAEVSPSEKTML
ncbi:MAG: MerR family transcriptional regulator [Bulleidia sp.]|nr:MerR family transcriptional regulator [Bulleidia sp.]